MKTGYSLAGHGVLLAVLGIGLSSCSLLDVRSAAKQDYITPLTPALLGEQTVPAPPHRPSPEKASKKDGPEGYRFFLNIIRVPFLPVGAAAELLFGGLSRTVI